MEISKCEVTTQVEGELYGEKKGNKSTKVTVAIFQYFCTAFVLYLFSSLHSVEAESYSYV